MTIVSLAPEFKEAESPPPFKECPQAKAYKVHKPHVWHKPGKEKWQYHCDGILPEDEQPPCQVFISPAQPECGEPAPTFVRVKTKLIDATVNTCRKHKSEYEQHAAAQRLAHRDERLKRAS